jgi:hypothetical protein
MGQPLDEETSGAQENQPEDGKNAQAKKLYTSPALIEYGSIAKLTEAGGFSAADGPVGFMMNP